MKYKPSMYNYIFKDADGSLLLYNSYTGTNSFAKVTPKKSEKVLQLLHKKEQPLDDEVFSKLLELGYFVLSGEDEKLKRELAYMEAVMDGTLQLIILPTENCNFRCKYCYETYDKGVMSEQTQQNIIKFVRKNLHKYNGLDVQWFGGEPLEAMEVVEYLSGEFNKLCKAANRPYTSGITTNGYNLTLDTFKKLKSYGVLTYQITIDGLREQHDYQRCLYNGGPTFDRIISNLLDIKKNVKSGLPRFMIRTNFTKAILDRITEYIEFFSKTFGDDKRFTFYVNKASDWGGDAVNQVKEQLIDENGCEKILTAFLNNHFCDSFSLHMSHLNSKSCVCYANRKNSYVIGSDGTSYKCTNNFDSKENVIGAIDDSGTMQIDEALHALWICKGKRDTRKCDNCFFSACCLMSSCPKSFIIKNDSSESDNASVKEMCLLEKEYLKIFLKLFDQKLFQIIQ